MSSQQERLQYLFLRFSANTCTKEELQELYSYFRQSPDESIYPLMDEQYATMTASTEADQIDWNKMYAQVMQNMETNTITAVSRPRRLFTLPRVAAAAAILVAIGLGAYWLFNNPAKKTAVPITNINNVPDIEPGGNKAILTIGDDARGTFVLDTMANGTIASLPGTNINKLEDGQLVYTKVADQSIKAPTVYNTLTTPRGGQYRLTLPDGSKVWLNAASVIRYPSAFTGNERRVSVKGEAYFEVAKDAARKFIVQAGPSIVEVIGTHFNVNAYPNEESTNTTLVEGSVKVEMPTINGQQVVLKPSQQIQVANVYQPGKFDPVRVRTVDTDPVIAWTRNTFSFSNISLANAMRQVERWYDVEVVFKDDIANEAIVASIPRDIPISKLMYKLSLTGNLHFTIEGKKITVTR